MRGRGRPRAGAAPRLAAALAWLAAALLPGPAGRAAAEPAPGSGGGLPWPLVFTQLPHAATPAAVPAAASPATTGAGWAFTTRHDADGARLVRLDPDGRLQVLSAGFAWAGEPAVSPEGTQLLFSARQVAGEPRSIWTLELAPGAVPRQLTPGAGDCGEPEYMSRNAINPPDFDKKVRWFVYGSDQAGGPDPRLGAPARHLFARSLEPVPGAGVVTWRTTFNPAGSELFPTMLADGRVLFSSFAPDAGATAGPAGEGRFRLFSIAWEGVEHNLVHGGAGAGASPRLLAMPVEAPDRTVVFVESDGERPDGGGRLAQLSWTSPLAAAQPLSADGARYRDPRPLPDGRLLVARAEGEGRYALVLFDRAAGRPAGLIHGDPAWDEVDPVVVAPHPEPMARIPAIWPDKFTTGDLHCMDAQDSDLPGLAGLPPGTVRTVRVVEALPASPAPAAALPPYDPGAPFLAPGWLRTRILGEVPVMPDGSFHVTLPADVPFTLQALDRDGVALATMRRWLWMKPWQMVTCTGCHADATLAPRNRVTTALRSLLLPVLGDSTRRPAPDFVHDVRPILAARCLGACHGPKVAPPATVLDGWSLPPYDRAYRTLVPRLARPGAARQSPLMRLLLADGGDGNQPRHAALLDGELRTLAAWIDLGARWDATRDDIPVPPEADGAVGAADRGLLPAGPGAGPGAGPAAAPAGAAGRPGHGGAATAPAP